MIQFFFVHNFILHSTYLNWFSTNKQTKQTTFNELVLSFNVYWHTEYHGSICMCVCARANEYFSSPFSSFRCRLNFRIEKQNGLHSKALVIFLFLCCAEKRIQQNWLCEYYCESNSIRPHIRWNAIANETKHTTDFLVCVLFSLICSVERKTEFNSFANSAYLFNNWNEVKLNICIYFRVFV